MGLTDILLSTLADQLLANKEFAVGLGIVIAGISYLVKNMGPRQVLMYEPFFRAWKRALHKYSSEEGRDLITEKDGTDDPDYVESVFDISAHQLLKILMDGDRGAIWNPTSTKKYRVRDDGTKQWAIFSVAFREGEPNPADDEIRMQTHVYAFRRPKGGFDLYAHKEPSPEETDEHHGGEDITHGDPDGKIQRQFDGFADGEYTRKSYDQ